MSSVSATAIKPVDHVSPAIDPRRVDRHCPRLNLANHYRWSSSVDPGFTRPNTVPLPILSTLANISGSIASHPWERNEPQTPTSISRPCEPDHRTGSSSCRRGFDGCRSARRLYRQAYCHSRRSPLPTILCTSDVCHGVSVSWMDKMSPSNKSWPWSLLKVQPPFGTSSVDRVASDRCSLFNCLR